MRQTRIKPAAVVLSLSATGLSVARSLGSRGVEVYGVDSNRWEIGHFSKYVQFSSTISFKQNTEQYIINLIEYAKSKITRPVLFVAADDEIQVISEYSELLKEHFIMPQSYTKEFTGRLLNKINLYAECKNIGVDIPVTFFPKNRMDLESISKKVPYPAIIKPDFRHEWQKRLKGKKVIEVGSAAELL
jgi:predicted ATP-grasp superfamily ATP-dependent carboligase